MPTEWDVNVGTGRMHWFNIVLKVRLTLYNALTTKVYANVEFRCEIRLISRLVEPLLDFGLHLHECV